MTTIRPLEVSLSYCYDQKVDGIFEDDAVGSKCYQRR